MDQMYVPFIIIHETHSDKFMLFHNKCMKCQLKSNSGFQTGLFYFFKRKEEMELEEKLTFPCKL